MAADELTPEQVATIERRMDQAFAFFRDVIDDPVLLKEIPGGSTLRFHDVPLGDVVVRLTAYPDLGFSWSWTARITGPADWVAEARKRDPSLPSEEGVAQQLRWWQPEHGHTAEEALVALEQQLRDATRQAESSRRIA